jgi:uncharacterized protein YceK
MKRNRAATLLAAVLAGSLLAGCATMSSKTVGSWGRPYSGVRCVGTEDYWDGLSGAMKGTQLIYSGTDYLFSAIFDTVFLPVDLIVDVTKKLTGSAGGSEPLCNEIRRRG